MSDEMPGELRAGMRDALAQEGLRPASIELISPYQPLKRGRFACRVETGDGRTVKLRHIGSAEDAQRLCEMRAGLEPAFAPILSRRGPFLIESWVDGTVLSREAPGVRSREAGALLGRLHSTAWENGGSGRSETSSWRLGAESDLSILAEGGGLDADAVSALRGELRRGDPGSARRTLIHRDYCAENVVVDREGRLTVIDNEWMTPGPAEFDLGRTLHRWPMPAQAWEEFLNGHASEFGEPHSLRFWTIVASLFGARVFLQWSDPRLDQVLAVLAGLLGSRDVFGAASR